MTDAVDAKEILQIAVGNLVANTWNPNVMGDTDFNETCRSIEESGMVDPILVRRMVTVHKSASVGTTESIIASLQDAKETFEIIDGYHRWQACRMIGRETIPAIVKDWDDDRAMAETFRLNQLRGKIDAVKFMRLWTIVSAKHGEEIARQMLALTDQTKFEEFVKKVRAGLPEGMKQKFDDRRTAIKTMADLSMVLTKLFEEYGQTIDQGYMFFTHGGSLHLMVRMDAKLTKAIDAITDICKKGGYDVNEVLVEMLSVAEAQMLLAKRMVERGESTCGQ